MTIPSTGPRPVELEVRYDRRPEILLTLATAATAAAILIMLLAAATSDLSGTWLVAVIALLLVAELLGIASTWLLRPGALPPLPPPPERQRAVTPDRDRSAWPFRG